MEKVKLKKAKRCTSTYPNPTRISKEMKEIITFIKAKYMLAGKKPPSSSKITKIIAKKIKKEELLRDEFIRF